MTNTHVSAIPLMVPAPKLSSFKQLILAGNSVSRMDPQAASLLPKGTYQHRRLGRAHGCPAHGVWGPQSPPIGPLPSWPLPKAASPHSKACSHLGQGSKAYWAEVWASPWRALNWHLGHNPPEGVLSTAGSGTLAGGTLHRNLEEGRCARHQGAWFQGSPSAGWGEWE